MKRPAIVPVKAAWHLLRCSHPEPVFAVTAANGVLAISAGRGWTTVWVVSAVLAGQLFVGWTNDYLDRDLDARAGRADKPLVAGTVSAQRVRNAALVALIACVPLSLANGVAPGLLHLAAVGVATLYNLGVRATPLSPVPYLFAFGAVPAFITLGLHPAHLPPAWATIAAALLGAGAHFTQVLPSTACLSGWEPGARRWQPPPCWRPPPYSCSSDPAVQLSCSWPPSLSLSPSSPASSSAG